MLMENAAGCYFIFLFHENDRRIYEAGGIWCGGRHDGHDTAGRDDHGTWKNIKGK